MAIKHVGYAVTDNKKNLLIDGLTGNLISCKNLYDTMDIVSIIDAEEADGAPHQVVRLLIDDELENEA